MKEDIVIPLFKKDFFKYFGALKNLEESSEGGVKPVVKPMNQLRGQNTFPYILDERENIKNFEFGSMSVKFLVPSRTIPGLTDKEYEKSIYHQLIGDRSERKEELEQKVADLKDRNGKLRKKVRELQAEQEEKDKSEGTSTGTTRLSCPSCGQTSVESKWRENSGWCPKCQQAHRDEEGVTKV